MNIKLTPPVSQRISQQFGENKLRYSRWDLLGHNGIDYECLEGCIVRVAHPGICTFSGYDKLYGNTIVISGCCNCKTIYAHLYENLIDTDSLVKQGAVIGITGYSGWCEYPHLHFGLKTRHIANGYAGYINPLPYMV